MPVDFFLECALGLLALAPDGIWAARRGTTAGAPVYGIAGLVTAGAAAAALGHLVSGPGTVSTLHLPIGLPWTGASFRLDALSALFLVIVDLGAAVACLYSVGYGRHEAAPGRVLPFFPAFLAAMNLVILADDAFSFLVSWEFMSLTSWALVLAHHREAGTARAGYVYLLMASFGTLCLLLAFGLLAGPDGAYSFATIRTGHPTPLLAALVLGLALLGAGSKAGLVPLHVWLPLAHPAAPSHVSALMSGIMTKVAIYGFIRIAFDLLGPPIWWWGLPIVALGSVTAVLGVLYALMQEDVKRILAYSTIENIGIVFVGLGLALCFSANGLPAAAALALTAALFHAFNHSLFKNLLFLGAGAVLGATGERGLDRLGGLIHRMKATALLFLTGAMAISALPPLNGFASEWLLFQSVLLSPQMPEWGAKLLVPAAGALLALSAALAAACFVRLFGLAFLGRPRGLAAETARETDRWSLAAMALLALLCLLAGILPGLVVDRLSPVVAGLVGRAMPNQAAAPWLSLIPIAESRSSYNGLLVLLFIAASATLTAFAVHRLASRAIRRGPAWDCGFPNADPATQYSAGGFSQPIARVFAGSLFGAREQVRMPPPGELAPARLDRIVHDPVWERIYEPIAGAVDQAAARMNRLQFLTIRRYLGLVFLALVALLLVLALWQ